MNIPIQNSHRSRFVGIVIATILLFITIVIMVISRTASATDSSSPHAGRLVTIYDRGEQKVILSQAATVGAAIKEAGISIDKNDAVEPNIDEKLVATAYDVNIYRARPVVVVDGAIRQKVISPYQTASQIAKDAGITIYDEDTTTLSRTSNIVAEGAGLILTIKRATPVDFVLYGKQTTIRTHATTVDAMLKEKGVVVAKDDTLSVPTSQTITAGMRLEIWRNGKQTVTIDEPIAFETQSIQNVDQPLGYKAIQTPGEIGKKTVTYEIEMKNGQQVGRKEIQSVVTQQPKKQVQVVGAKLPTPMNPTEAQVIGKQMMLNAGFSESQWPCLYNLWTRESGWRTTAGNPSSGAYGIPQALPASKMAAYGPDYMTNASTQIAWGLSYIKGRYSTPCGAWSAFNSRSPSWY